MKTLLVTGAGGFLGWNVCRRLAENFKIVGTVRSSTAIEEGVETRIVDLTRSHDVRSLLEEVRPDAVLHLAALSQPNRCAQQVDLSYRVNVEATLDLASWCARHDIPFVFTSSDLVFDGTEAPYGEDAPPSPLSLYGQHKVQAEQGILALGANAAVCRMPLMFGSPGPSGRNFFQTSLNALREGQALNLFVDEYRTPVSAAAAADGLQMVLEKSYSGILHLGGPERISRYDFGVLAAEGFGLCGATIRAVRQVDLRMPATRPPDVSLDSRRAFEMGYRPGRLKDQLIRLREEDV